MDHIEQPSRFNLAPVHEQFRALFFWPAFSPAQAMSNEWVLERVALLDSGTPEATAARARLEEFTAMTLDDREVALESVMQIMAADDPMHPNNVLCTLMLNGAPIYGRCDDLLAVAAALAGRAGEVQAYKAEVPVRVDLSHILTTNLGYQ